MQTNFDFIIVGGGTAGVILAYRLLQSGKFTVLLVEEGEDKSHPYLQIPLAVGKLLSNKDYVWPYYTDAEPHLNNRSIYSPTGRLLGGSSAVNGTVFARGPKEKYNEWQNIGCDGFGYESLDKYFRSIEKFSNDSKERGSEGLIHVTASEYKDKLSNLFINSCEALGYSKINDYNVEDNQGISSLQYTTKNGLRQSVANTYYNKIKNNKKFRLLSKSTVTKILIHEKEAIGCCVQDQLRERKNFYASHEVIICAGAIQTPALLQRSGIGNFDNLSDLGIPCIINSPNVGVGLQDHANVRVSYTTTSSVKTLNDYLSSNVLFSKLVIGYLFGRRNLLATPSATTHLLLKSDPKMQYPDLKLQLVHLIESKRFGVGKETKLSNNSGFSIGVSYLFPKSSGVVKLKSMDNRVHPSIVVNYLADSDDQYKTVQGIKIARNIISKAPIENFVKAEIQPGHAKQSFDELLNFAKETCQSGYHFACSCRMGSETTGVVDNKFRVYGVNKLRLCDASVMPFLTSSNIQAVVMMLAEKAASEIISKYSYN